MKTVMRLLLFAIAVWFITSCVPLYIPPVPAHADTPHDLRVVNVVIADEEISVAMHGDVDGWVVAQWFAVNGRELGSHAVWLEVSGAASTAVFPDVVPDAVYIVFSYRGQILRIFHK